MNITDAAPADAKAQRLAQLNESRREIQYRAEIDSLRQQLAGTQAALADARTIAADQQRHLERVDSAFRQELATVRATLAEAQAENERLRAHLRDCRAISDLIITAARQANSDRQ
jgi:hypothetical protein